MLICLIALGIELVPAGVSGSLGDLGGLGRDDLDTGKPDLTSKP